MIEQEPAMTDWDAVGRAKLLESNAIELANWRKQMSALVKAEKYGNRKERRARAASSRREK